MKEILYHSGHKIITPDLLSTIPENSLMSYATQASKLIKKLGKGNMFNYPPEDLLAFLHNGMAIFSLAPSDEEKLSGIVKVDPWVIYPNGKPKENGIHGSKRVLEYIDSDIAKIVGLESGSLVVDKPYQGHHLGSCLKKTMAEIATQQFPGISIFSVVTDTNTPSIKANKSLGWTIITPEQSQHMIGIDVINVEGWDPTVPVTIFVYPPSLNGNRT